MGLTVSQWADRVLDRRSEELPETVTIRADAPEQPSESTGKVIKTVTRLVTGKLPALTDLQE